MSATMRIPSRAHADSTRMLRASARVLAWIALMASEGMRQLVSYGWRPPSSCVPSSIPACLRKVASSMGSAAMLAFSSAVSGRTRS